MGSLHGTNRAETLCPWRRWSPERQWKTAIESEQQRTCRGNKPLCSSTKLVRPTIVSRTAQCTHPPIIRSAPARRTTQHQRKPPAHEWRTDALLASAPARRRAREARTARHTCHVRPRAAPRGRTIWRKNRHAPRSTSAQSGGAAKGIPRCRRERSSRSRARHLASGPWLSQRQRHQHQPVWAWAHPARRRVTGKR